MRHLNLTAALIFAAAILGTDGPATAGTTVSKHGVRLHKLMEPGKRRVKQARRRTVAPHTHSAHRHKSLNGVRVRFLVRSTFSPSLYRLRHPGMDRPWAWRHSRGRKDFAQPAHLYRSKIYTRRY
ncbi:MAG: hypothetical protein ACR2O4_09870 [Hyphomicrobiaceae bacterium]